MTLSGYFMTKSVFGQQSCRALTLALARLSSLLRHYSSSFFYSYGPLTRRARLASKSNSTSSQVCRIRFRRPCGRDFMHRTFGGIPLTGQPDIYSDTTATYSSLGHTIMPVNSLFRSRPALNSGARKSRKGPTGWTEMRCVD